MVVVIYWCTDAGNGNIQPSHMQKIVDGNTQHFKSYSQKYRRLKPVLELLEPELDRSLGGTRIRRYTLTQEEYDAITTR